MHDDDDWDWLFEAGFFLWAPLGVVAVVLILWALGVITL